MFNAQAIGNERSDRPGAEYDVDKGGKMPWVIIW